MTGKVACVGRWALVGALAFPVGTIVTAAPAASAAAKKKEDDKAFKVVAHVKVEIKQQGGKVLKNAATVEFGQDGQIELASAEHKHSVKLKIDRPDATAAALSITVGYDRDGQAIIAPYTFDSEVKKREVLEIEGGTAIAVTVTSKKVAAPPPEVEAPPSEDPPPGPRNKLVLDGDRTDPLGGLQ